MTADDRTALEMILGVPDGAGSFAILDLEVREIEDAEVIDALSKRMGQVAAHPLSETADGNEARLALHAAAARLLDPAVRRAVLDRVGLRESVRPVVSTQGLSPTQEQGPLPPPRPTGAGMQMGPQALLVVAAEGGWNSHALRRLAMLAHARGIPSDEVPAAVSSVLQTVLGPVGKAGQTPTADRKGTVPRTSKPPGISKADRGGIFVTVLAILALVVLVLTWQSLLRATERAKSEQAAAGNTGSFTENAQRGISESEPLVAESSVADTTANTAEALPVPDDEPNWLAAAVGIVDSDEPADGEVLRGVLEGMSRTWLSRSEAERALAQTVLVDMLYQYPPAAAVELINSLGAIASGDELVAATWATGMLARLSQEGGLPRGVDSAIVAALADAIGGRVRSLNSAFGKGVLALLQERAEQWASGSRPEPLAVDGWVRSAERLTTIDQSLGQSAFRAALDTVLRGDADTASSTALRDLLGHAARRLELPDESENIAFVLAAVSDSAVDPGKLAVMLGALRAKPSLADVAGAMDLPPTASASRRADLRAALESAWLNRGPSTWASEEWLALARAQLDRPVPRESIEQLGEAVVLARLSAAASSLLWGDEQRAESLLATLRDDIDNGPRPGHTSGRPGVMAGETGNWSDRYLEARRNIPVRQSLLTELVRARPALGPVAAELLVGEALAGSPVQVRRQAAEALPVFSSQPTVVNAMLEMLPRVPRVRSNGNLVEIISNASLPAIDDLGWPIEARRAVVARLLRLIAGEGPGQRFDELATLLADAYANRLARGQQPSTALQQDLPVMTTELRRYWLDEARRIDRTGEVGPALDRLNQTLEGRLALAESEVLRFAALQVSAVEAAALALRYEQPASGEDIQSILNDLAEARRQAGTAFEQIMYVERAHLRLWLLRTGGAS